MSRLSCVIVIFVLFGSICPSHLLAAKRLDAKATSQDVTCYGQSNGAINLSVEDGTAPYTFLWSNQSSSQNITGLSKGTYTVTVSDAEGSTVSATTTIDEPAQLSAELNITNACFGVGNGTVEVNVTGGVSPYEYLYFGGVAPLPIDSGSADSILAGTSFLDRLGPVNLTVIVKDRNNCTVSVNGVVEEIPEKKISAKIKEVSCLGASDASIDVTYDQPEKVNYRWTTLDTSLDISYKQDIEDLSPGLYKIFLNDEYNCWQVWTFNIVEPPVPTRSVEVTYPSCHGASDGAIDLTISGGREQTYLWSNGATTEDIGSLAAGEYHIAMTDKFGCTTIDSIVLEAPTGLTTSKTVVNATCNGSKNGSVDVAVSGGVSPLSFKWSNEEETMNITNLAVGKYFFTVEDATGCSLADSVIISFDDSVVISTTTKNASCAGLPTGEAKLRLSGDESPYHCFWSNGRSGIQVDMLGPGSHFVTVVSHNGCTAKDSFIIRQDTFTIKAVARHECFDNKDGGIKVEGAGGLEPYSYLWNDGTMLDKKDNLSAGTYAVSVVDNQGCSDRDSVKVNNLMLKANVSVKNSTPKVKDGVAKLNVSGDAPPYSFVWSNKETTREIKGLAPGSYSATITDSNGCTVEVAKEVQ